MQHKSYSVEEIARVIDAKAILQAKDVEIRNISFDSRKLIDMEHTLFFALEGRRDGHDFLKEVYHMGVRNFVISSQEINVQNYVYGNFFQVEDTRKALQQLTAWHRSQYTYPVVGITGSNGKTVVKEWLFQLLSSEYNIIRSPKSYNSQIGVPLSVWGMTDEHSLGIFEVGISKAAEMDALERIVQPTIGILTNIGDAHNEGFESREQKIREKLLLFENADLLIYSPDYLSGYKGIIPGKRKFTWAWNQSADLNVLTSDLSNTKQVMIRAEYVGKQIQCKVPFTDGASIENAIVCWATMLALNYDPELAALRLEKLLPVKMRLELKNGINNCSIIDDSYSSDISSLAIALDFLGQQNQHHKKTLILSDIPEAGIQAEILYRRIAKLLNDKKVDRLIGVGREIGWFKDLFSQEGHFFESTEALLGGLDTLKLNNETILLKGARSFKFENISKALTQKVHETVLEINLNAVEHNLNYYKSQLKPGVKLMVMVKAFSYGSGSFEIANLLQFNKVDYLAVAYADEGVTLRKAGIALPIMVMNPDFAAFDLMVEYQLEPELYSLRILKEFSSAVELKGLKSYPVHLKLDTGMHRLGFMPDEIDDLNTALANNHTITIMSAFSHLVASEDPASDNFTKNQLESFLDMTVQIEQTLKYSFIKHISNTSGISRHPRVQLDMVRLGIGLYGFDSSLGNKHSPLETVTVLKTSISQIKELRPGDTVGYNRRGVLPEGGRTATVKIGYADGYSRKLGNGRAKMWINGQAVPTIGNICMDMCMLDISGIHAEEGDEVIVFKDTEGVQELAAIMETISYEVITGISERVKRVYFYE